jgi:hypothetical protein
LEQKGRHNKTGVSKKIKNFIKLRKKKLNHEKNSIKPIKILKKPTGSASIL